MVWLFWAGRELFEEPPWLSAMARPFEPGSAGRPDGCENDFVALALAGVRLRAVEALGLRNHGVTGRDKALPRPPAARAEAPAAAEDRAEPVLDALAELLDAALGPAVGAWYALFPDPADAFAAAFPEPAAERVAALLSPPAAFVEAFPDPAAARGAAFPRPAPA